MIRDYATIVSVWLIAVVLFTADANSQTIWSNVFGGGGDESATSVALTPDGGSIIAGYTTSKYVSVSGIQKRGKDIIVLKLDKLGALAWMKVIGGSKDDQATSIVQTVSGDYVLAGTTASNDGDFSGKRYGATDAFVIKLDKNGSVVWSKTFGGSGTDIVNALARADGGGVAVVGSTTSNDGDFRGRCFGAQDAFIIRLSDRGAVIWLETLGGADNDKANGVAATEDDGFMVVGESGSSDGDLAGLHKGGLDMLVCKYDRNGNLIWCKLLGGASNESAATVAMLGANRALVAGHTYSRKGADFEGVRGVGAQDIVLAMIETNGRVVYKKVVGGAADDQATCVAAVGSGYVVAGTTSSNDGLFSGMRRGREDGFLVEYSSSGSVNERVMLGGSDRDRISGVVVDNNQRRTLVGETLSNDAGTSGRHHGKTDVYVAQHNPFGRSLSPQNIGVYYDAPGVDALSHYQKPLEASSSDSKAIDHWSNSSGSVPNLYTKPTFDGRVVTAMLKKAASTVSVYDNEKVDIVVSVGSDGIVKRARVIGTNNVALINTLTRAVKAVSFKPARIEGVSIDDDVMISYEVRANALRKSKYDEVMDIPVGITVLHSPNPVRAMHNGRSGFPLTWLFTTTVRASKRQLTIVEFGYFNSVGDGWVHGRAFSSTDFADWYDCPAAKLTIGRAFSDANNWSGSYELRRDRRMWYFIGLDEGGKQWRGTAVVEELGAMEE